MAPASDLGGPLPEPEARFREALRDHYRDLGYDPASALTAHWVDAMGPSNYRAGELAVREIGALLDPAGRRVLDVGCGFAGTLLHLARRDARPVGLEYDQQRLALARQRLESHGLRAALLAGDGFRLPFADEAFDIVVATDVLEHVPGCERMVAELARVLRRGGLLYLAFPNLLSLRNAWRDPHYHLFGATLLPRRWADAYTRRVRGEAYDCQVLPVAGLLARRCRGLGVEVHAVRSSERVLLERIAEPSTIRGPLRPAFVLAGRLGLRPLLRGLVRLRSTLGAHAVLAGFKR